MKTDKLIVVVQAKNGKTYQVALTDEETRIVMSTISYMHDGNVRCFEEELPLQIKKKAKRKK